MIYEFTINKIIQILLTIGANINTIKIYVRSYADLEKVFNVPRILDLPPQLCFKIV
jgi:hypothetical protein